MTTDKAMDAVVGRGAFRVLQTETFGEAPDPERVLAQVEHEDGECRGGPYGCLRCNADAARDVARAAYAALTPADLAVLAERLPIDDLRDLLVRLNERYREIKGGEDE